jgi:hypothetical protein
MMSFSMAREALDRRLRALARAEGPEASHAEEDVIVDSSTSTVHRPGASASHAQPARPPAAGRTPGGTPGLTPGRVTPAPTTPGVTPGVPICRADFAAREEETGAWLGQEALALALDYQLRDCSGDLALLWENAVMPALFASLGSSMQASTVFAGGFIGEAVACLFVGVTTRVVVTACIGALPLGQAGSTTPGAPLTEPSTTDDADGHDGNYTAKEVLFLALAWMGKASVQAALGAIALERVAELYADTAATADAFTAAGGVVGDANATAAASVAMNLTAADVTRIADYQQALADARVIHSIASLSALFFAPLAALCLNALGPLCLRPK